MNLMMGDIPHLLDVIWSWISPSEDEENVFRPHGDPQMIRFGAHLVLVLRYLLVEQMKDAFREKIMTVGDLILHIYQGRESSYVMFICNYHLKAHIKMIQQNNSSSYSFLISKILAPAVEKTLKLRTLRNNKLYVELGGRMLCYQLSWIHKDNKKILKYEAYLPFSPGDDSKGSFKEIVERVLSRCREIKPGKYDKSSNVAEQHQLQSLQKAMVIQWLCFTPPSTINDAQASSAKLLLRALLHSNILFREFALISIWRVPAMPIGAHTLLSFLAKPLKQPTETLLSTEDHDVSENLREFQDRSKYYSCDATYRNWLKVELKNVKVSPLELSVEEKRRAIAAAKETLNSSFSLLLRKENPWLVPTEDHVYESVEPLFLELHAIEMLCLPSGECMCPDATLCATLLSALYSSVSKEVVLNRQLMVGCAWEPSVAAQIFGPSLERGVCRSSESSVAPVLDLRVVVSVSISSTDNYCIEVVLCCLATDGDGLGPHELNDGGILATVIATGFKERACLISSWCNNGNLTTRCLVFKQRWFPRRPNYIHRVRPLSKVSISLVESGNPPESHDELIELVASPETGFLHLFSQQQLQS
ncbi:unnamed protein product [Camellia sinensis]